MKELYYCRHTSLAAGVLSPTGYRIHEAFICSITKGTYNVFRRCPAVFSSHQPCPQPLVPRETSHLLGLSCFSRMAGYIDSSTEGIFTWHVLCAIHFPRYKNATTVKTDPSSALFKLTYRVVKIEMHQMIPTECGKCDTE